MKRLVLVVALALSASTSPNFARAANAEATSPEAAPHEIRIGYQKNGDLLILKGRGSLEKRLAPHGTSVTWVLFPSGPPMLEALNAGAIDFGATGDTPPIFAQAAGSKLVYVAAAPVPGDSQAILVRKDSGIETLADLKGKRVAYTRGSSAHWLLAAALARAKLGFGDITSINLQPPDATAAFQNGQIDAWSIWDPFYAAAQRLPNARVLATSKEVAPSSGFFLASRDFVTTYPATTRDLVAELTDAAAWERTHRADLATVLARSTGLPLDVETVAANRGYYDVGYVTDAQIQRQQTIADAFFKLGLIPSPVDVRAAVWSPTSKRAAR